MPQYDYTHTYDEVTEPVYRQLDVEVKRPKKLHAVLWWIAGLLWALLFIIMTVVAFYNR